MQISTMRRAAVTVAGLALIGAACGSSSNKNSSGASTTASGGAASGAASALPMPTGVKCSGIALAFFGAYTGSDSGLGIPIYNGAKLAIDQFNAANPGCQVGYKKFDSQGSADQAPQLARSIVGDSSLVGVVGPAFSGESKAADPIFNQATLPIITPSATNAKLQTNGWTIFHRLLANDDAQAPGDAAYIKDTVKAQKVFVIDDASEYGKGLADTVKSALGSLVVGTDEINPKGATDYSSTVTKVKAADPDAVFYGGYYSQAGPLAKQLRDGGVTKAVIVSGDGTKDNGYVKLAGDAANGTILTCTCGPSPAAFADSYQKAFNTAPGTYAPEAYDSAYAFLQAIGAGKTTRKDINDYLKTINVKGVTKQIQFDQQGEVTAKAVYLYKVDNGQITAAGTVGS